MQLDLFLHSQDLMLRNDVVAALRRREPQEVRAALDALTAAYPADAALAPLRTLHKTLTDPPARFSSHDQALAALVLRLPPPACHLA